VGSGWTGWIKWDTMAGEHVHIDLLHEGCGGAPESLADDLDRYPRAQCGGGVTVPDVVRAA
jgi:hypothetical protein